MNFPLPLWPWAVVEITAETAADDRRGLILAAYRASRAGVVGLALRGVTPEAIDDVLDGVVDVARDGELKGVVYLDGTDEAALLAAAAHAGLVVASTTRFRERLSERGIAAVGPRDARSLLGSAAAGRRPEANAVA